MNTEQMIEKLVEVGGSEWQRGGKHRVYFNNLHEWYGLKLSFYNTGNLSSATLDGDHMSNTQASRLYGRLCAGRVWWDAADGKFYGRIDDELFRPIVKAIKKEIEVETVKG